MQLPRPETGSVPPKVSVTGPLYQPALLGCRSGATVVTAGAVASNLSGKTRSAALPARSVQRPITDASALSGDEYVTAGHVSTPEVVSVPTNVYVTARLYQSPASGLRSGARAVTCGAVASYFKPYGNEALPLPALSVHVPLTDAVALSGPL